MELSSIVSYIFIASVAAAGLVYTAGTLITRSISNAKQMLQTYGGINESFRTIFERSLFNELVSIQKRNTILMILNVNIFLISNFLVLIYWIFDNDLTLNLAIGLYASGIILMLGTVSTLPIIWSAINAVPPIKVTNFDDFRDVVFKNP